ncbi:MAG TPA: FG-GAP-like repeat-containing protein [bacterium]|nr:FG-GAP-like repeat-containing protein [bacterium]
MRTLRITALGLFLMGFAITALAGHVITSVEALGAIRIVYPGTEHYEMGAAVSGAGDFNGDGFLDVAIGAPSYDPGGFGNEYDNGAVFIVFGTQLNRDRGLIDLSSPEFDGVVVMGRFESRLGHALALAGDVNADGFADLAVGSENGNAGYILFGKKNSRRLIPVADLRDDGVEITHTGFAVDAAGDVNGDGFPDVVFGMPAASRISVKTPSGQEEEYDIGRVVVVYGRRRFPQILDSRIREYGVLPLRGIAGSRVGEYVCGNFDLNADGFSDLFVVAPKGGRDLEGRAVLLQGRSQFETIEYSFLIDHARHFIRNAGDVNGDGFPDFLVGMEDQSVLLLWGGDYLHGAIDLRNLDARWGCLVKGAQSAFGVGDVNGDGFSDIAVALPMDYVRDKAFAGRVVFLFGQMEWPSSLDIRKIVNGDITQVNYVVVEGVEPFEAFGSHVAGVGDIQGDGFADVLIGAPTQRLPGELRMESPGSAYLIQGRSLFMCLQTRRSQFFTQETPAR